MRPIEVEIVERKPSGIRGQLFFEPFSQPAFAGATPADKGNQFYTISHGHVGAQGPPTQRAGTANRRRKVQLDDRRRGKRAQRKPFQKRR